MAARENKQGDGVCALLSISDPGESIPATDGERM
jgi:hypothetical protein